MTTNGYSEHAARRRQHRREHGTPVAPPRPALVGTMQEMNRRMVNVMLAAPVVSSRCIYCGTTSEITMVFTNWHDDPNYREPVCGGCIDRLGIPVWY
jgi:hypothetical protein